MKKFQYQEKQIGTLNHGVFRKEVRASKHLFRKTNAWGISLRAFKSLPEDTKIEIWDKDTKTLYTAVRSDLEGSGEVYEFPGYEPQIFIPTHYFAKIEKTPEEKEKEEYLHFFR